MAKTRVYELAKELGTDSKTLLQELMDDGERVRSASSTLEHPVVRRIRERHGLPTPPRTKPQQGQRKPHAPQRPAEPPRPPRHTPWTVKDLARKLRLDPATLTRFLTDHDVPTAGALPDAVVDQVAQRLLVNRNTSGPPQLVLMPGEALADVARRDPAAEGKGRDGQSERRQSGGLEQAVDRVREQERRRIEQSGSGEPTTGAGAVLASAMVDGPAVDRSEQLWRAALRRWNGQRAELSRQVRSAQWSSNPRQLRSLSTHWSKVHLVEHHKALLKGLSEQRMKACGLHRGTREALVDAQLFWMPQSSVRRIAYTGRVDLAGLVPRDVSTGLVAFESLVPADPAAGWLASDIPGVRDHAYRSMLWFVVDDTVYVIGWRHVHPLAVTDPDGIDPALLRYLRDSPLTRPVWSDTQLQDVCASWPWVPTTHFSYRIQSTVDLAEVPNPDRRACLAALALAWADIAATRRPPRTSTDQPTRQQQPSPEEQFEQHRLITPGTRFVQLRRTSDEELHRIGPDHQVQRTYHFSWMVRGHQRRQHYGPGGTLTKVIDIAPHKRGPRGAPMLGPKVYLLPPPR